MRDNLPNYLNPHNVDPSRVEAAQMRNAECGMLNKDRDAAKPARCEKLPGNDSIRPGQRIGTVGVVGRGFRHFALDAERVKQMLHGSLFYPHDQEKLLDIQPITMSNAEAIEILKHLEADIYGRIAIAKAIDALMEREVKE